MADHRGVVTPELIDAPRTSPAAGAVAGLSAVLRLLDPPSKRTPEV
jgi:hypothetical protein